MYPKISVTDRGQSQRGSQRYGTGTVVAAPRQSSDTKYSKRIDGSPRDLFDRGGQGSAKIDIKSM